MIRAGLIGGRLSHSLSPQIHEEYWRLTGRRGHYRLLETPEDQLGPRLDALMAQGYMGVNVTIPHKSAVMRHLNSLSPEAAAIGAVNTVHFTGGRRVGHNTDYFGLKAMMERHGMALTQKSVAILGAGGAARCALCLARDEGAAEILVVSRRPDQAGKQLGAVGYGALDAAGAIDVLINTTPAGMYPDIEACPVSDAVIEKCAAVADLIYNPAKTMLLKKAAALGKAVAGGLWMLCAQALKAEEIWTGRAYDEALCANIFGMLGEPARRAHAGRTNIVLIGMPGSGKTTVGQMLAQRLSRAYCDTDTLIEAAHGRIADIFAKQGEAAFRAFELAAARQAAARARTVISTGGGVVLTPAAMEALRETGVVVYIDRPLELLLDEVETADRPLLADGRQRLTALFSQRSALYRQYADITVQNAADAQSCADDILEKIKGA